MNTMNLLRRLLIMLAITAGSLAVRADVFLVPDPTADRIARVNGAGVVSSAISTGLDTPEQVAVDANGNLYVADSAAGKVLQFPAAGGGPNQIGDAVAGVTSLAFDKDGVLHVAIPGDRTIRKLVSNTFQILTTLEAGASPRCIAFAPGGNLFAAAGNKIFEVTPAGGSSPFSSDVTAPFAVAFDSTGKLFVTDTQQGGRILTFTGNSGNTKDEATGLGAVRGLAFDRANVAHYLTSGGELRKVINKTTSALVAGGLGDARLLTVRSASTLVVAFKGQTLTDPVGASFASFGSPAIGGGLVAFKATLQTGVLNFSSANASGLWRADSAGTITEIARKSIHLPGDADATSTVISVTDPVLNNNGRIAFTAKFKSGTTSGVAVMTDSTGGTLVPLVKKGEQAPGLDLGVKFTAFKQVVLADDAGPAFLASVAGPGIGLGNNLGLWSTNAAGVVSLVVRKGDMITVGGRTRKLSTPALFKGAPLTLGHGRHAALGQQFTFTAKFTDGFTALLLVQPGTTPTVLAEKGGMVGSAINGALFASFGSPCVTKQADKFAFLSKLVPSFGGVTSASAGAIFTQAAATNDLVAQKTFGAPGVTGAFFATIGDPVMSPSGALAFFGKMKAGLGGVLSGTAAGLWANTGGGLDNAVRQGDPAPGISGTVKFTAFRQFVLPDTGGVVFTASVAGSGITTSNNLGLWADDGTGGLELLIRKGDKVKINGQTKTATSFTIFKAVTGVTGQSRQFDTSGNVVCQVSCSDGTKAIFSFRRP